jgi:nucleoside-diphosphate-sugar epimerase
MRVLVTGAGGFIGKAMLDTLGKMGLDMRALFHERHAVRLPLRCQSYTGDLGNPEFCVELCKGIDVIIHLAAQAHVGGPRLAHLRNSHRLAVNLAEAAVANGVKQFIFISSTKANFPQHSAYAAVKKLTEDYLLGLHQRKLISVVCLRPPLVYGPGMQGNLATLLSVLHNPWLLVFIRSSNRVGMISLDDCCRAIAAALDKPQLFGRVWELNDGRVYTLTDIIHRVLDIRKLRQPFLILPRPLVKLLAFCAELSAPLTKTAFSMGTYRALYEEPYLLDMSYAKASGFVPYQDFYSQLPTLLEP